MDNTYMKIPVATYRIQFNPQFGFQNAADILSYLDELGITDFYASPVFKAKAGSPHGYDVVDLNQLNPDLGTDEEFDTLIEGVKKLDMGWLQDIVPNHMAFDGENQMLMDVLENGRHSEYFDYFDVEWEHFYESLSERLLAPFLGKHYSQCLDDGEITLQYNSIGFSINYYALKLPLKIESYVRIITHGLQSLRRKLGDDHPDLIKFLGILYSLKNLPEAQEERLGRYSQIQFIKRMLWELYNDNSLIKEFIDSNVQLINGDRENKDNVSHLESLLSEQLFRLSFWKVATEELNYRRFFNINGLISLRVEEERVFHNTHRLILKLVKDRTITGLRIDHIDGLYDPTAYLRRLREITGDIFIAVEKILEPGEELSPLWAVQGTTGYDFLNFVNGIFCYEENGRVFNKLYYSYTGFKTSYEAMLYEKKRLVLEKDMTGDVDNLAHLLKRTSSNDRYGGDITLYGLKRAIKEILALFPVYRTYITDDDYSDADRSLLKKTIAHAREMNPAMLYEFNFIERFLLMDFRDDITEDDRKNWVHFVMRFQQFTGPLMAKGFEDTLLYVYNRLLSLNDVGGSPDRFGIPLSEFHDFNEERSHKQPHSMNATSTHDSKRGEDVRARINVLSEIPEVWEANLRKWSKLNRRRKKAVRGAAVPDRNDEYFLYQTMIGAMPFNSEDIDSFKERLKRYIIKAVREAKVYTAWLKPDSDYEDNFMAFIDKILTPSDKNVFLQEFLSFQKMIAHYGVYNSLSQTLIKITSPGFPDFYQGSEFWDLNLVDPDNRRPVDFELMTWLFRELKAKEKENRQKILEEIYSTREDGRIKLYLTYKALNIRKEYKTLFEKGSYIPVETSGTFQNNIIAFAREHRPHYSITVAPRFLTKVAGEGVQPLGRDIWKDTKITLPDNAPSSWKEVFTGSGHRGKKKLFVGDVLKNFPVAMLVNVVKG